MDDLKKWLKMLKYVGGCFAAGMILIGAFVWFVDPFYHYHKPFGNFPVMLENAVYQTAGAAKNLDYDSAIIGTSMTENMHTSWFVEEMGWDAMKLSYSGARSADLKAIFGEIEKNDGELRNIVMDLNDYQLTCESWTEYVERPEYLYDENARNDYKYLLNRDVVSISVCRCMDALLGNPDNIDSAYTWEENILFGRDIAKQTVAETRNSLIWERYQQFGEEGLYLTSGQLTKAYAEYIDACQENLDNITPFIQSHPDTIFHVMIPPYSMLYWEEKVLSGKLEDTMAVYAYAIKELLQYDNVKIYYFQDEEEIITNLDNYRDNCHHRPEYNRYMFECIRDGRNLITLENYAENITAMYEFVSAYPYIELWEE